MADTYDAPPFGAPMSSFIQTGANAPFSTAEEKIEDFSEAEAGTIPEQVNPLMPNGSMPFAGPIPAQTQTTSKYQIFDIFWLFNPGLNVQPPRLVQGQAHVAIISFNISFGNLRISFFNVTQNSIRQNVAFLNNMQRLVSGTIYPSSAFCIYTSPRIATICIEQLFQSTGAEWQQNRPICKVEKNEQKIRVTIKDQKVGKYFYDFEEWQRDAFLQSCLFTYTTGMYLHGLNQIK